MNDAMGRRRGQRSPRRLGTGALRVASLASALVAALPGTSRAWQAHFGSVVFGYSAALSVAIDGERNVIAGGIVDAKGDFIGVATVVKLAPDGTLLWRTPIDARGSWAERVFVDPAGDVLVGGTKNAADENDTGQPSVAKLDGSTGAVLWRSFDPLSTHDSARVLPDRDGNVLIEYRAWRDRTREDTVGVCRKLSGRDGSVLWQSRHCSTLQAVDASGDLYVGTCSKLRKLAAADGHELWRTRVPITLCGDPQYGQTPVAVDPAGDVVVAGGDSAAKVSGVNGALVWTTRLDVLPATFIGVVTIDADGDVLLGGATGASSSSSDAFVAKLAGGDGQRRWQRRFAGHGPDGGYRWSAHDLTIDADGNVLVAARLQRRGRWDVMIKLDGERGRKIWLRAVPGAIVDVATDPSGAIALGGENDLPVNEWNDPAFGFWLVHLSSEGDGLTPPDLY